MWRSDKIDFIKYYVYTREEHTQRLTPPDFFALSDKRQILSRSASRHGAGPRYVKSETADIYCRVSERWGGALSALSLVESPLRDAAATASRRHVSLH